MIAVVVFFMAVLLLSAAIVTISVSASALIADIRVPIAT